MIQSMNPSMNQKIADEWTTDDFGADSSPNSFRQVYQNILVQQQPPSSPATCQGLPATSFPLNTASYSYTSSLLHTLFDAESQPQQPLLENEPLNFRMNSAEVVHSLRPSFPKQQQNFQFINNTAFWNATAPASCGDVRASFLPSSTPQLIPSAVTKPKLNQRNFGSKVHMQILRLLLRFLRFSTVNLI